MAVAPKSSFRKGFERVHEGDNTAAVSFGRGDRKEEAPADDAGGVAGRAWITAVNGGPQLSGKGRQPVSFSGG